MDYGAVWGTFLAFLFLTVYFIWIMAKEINENRESRQRACEREKRKTKYYKDLKGRNSPQCVKATEEYLGSVFAKLDILYQECRQKRDHVGLVRYSDIHHFVGLLSELRGAVERCDSKMEAVKPTQRSVYYLQELHVRFGFLQRYLETALKGIKGNIGDTGFSAEEYHQLEQFVLEHKLCRIDKEGSNGTERPANPD